MGDLGYFGLAPGLSTSWLKPYLRLLLGAISGNELTTNSKNDD